jgi:imidazolonepropionase-like amidohydrolase
MKAIAGGRILTVAGEELENALVLIEDGRFTSLGPGEVPAGAEIIDATGKYVAPGMVDAHTHIGLEDFGETTSPVTPHVRILDSIKLNSPGFEDALLAGVTTVIVTPGSSNVISGTSLVMKTAGPDLPTRILRDPAGMKMAWRKGTNRPSHDVPYPMSLMGIAGVLRNALVETRNYMARRERNEVPEDPVKELMAAVLRRELPVRIHSFTPVEIQAICRLQDEFGFYFTCEHGFEAHFLADELARRGVPVVYGPGPGLRRHKMFPYRGPHGAAILHHAGVKVALQTDHPDRSIKQLRIFGALLLRYTDLTPPEVMRMLTINGAEIAGVADRVGSIELGKDADFAIYSGHPLKVQSRVEQVYINGIPVVVNEEVVVNPYGWAKELARM